MLINYTNAYLPMLKFATFKNLTPERKFMRNLVKYVLLIPLAAILFSGCYTNRSIMLKTPKDFVFDTITDSMRTKDTYRVAIADIVLMDITTNEGRQKLNIINDAAVINSARVENAGSGTGNYNSYVVEPDSTINIPVLGRVKVAGLTVRQVEGLLEDKFSKYYIDPFVDVRVNNRRVMVFMGGNFAKVLPLTNDRTTLMEGIALAGGILPLSKAKGVKLIRGNINNPQVYEIDLSTLQGATQGGGIILQANDIIYVDPVRQNATQIIQYVTTYASLAVSLSVLIIALTSN